MPIFRRRANTATIERPASATPSSVLLCNERGCARSTALACSYRDRRGRACPAAFCLEHGAMVAGLPYCRRHGGTMLALGSKVTDAQAMPDLANRAPSLVNWIARDLDEPVRGLLSRLSHDGEQVVSDQMVSTVHDVNRNPHWERSWRIVDHTGVIVKVTVMVDSDDDTLVHVRVGGEDVVRAVPPWIDRRRRGQQEDPEVDSSQRRIFYRFIEENITATAQRFREAGDRPPWSA